MNAQERAEDLLSHGYVEIQEAGRLRVGQRVRHAGQQYPEAYRKGTGVIEQMFRSPRVICGKEDIELIVKRDKPEWGPDDTHGYWADYHTALVEDEA